MEVLLVCGSISITSKCRTPAKADFVPGMVDYIYRTLTNRSILKNFHLCRCPKFLSY